MDLPFNKDNKLFSPISIGVLVIVLCVLLPMLNGMGVIEDHKLNLWGKYLCYACLAISVNMLWGYTGLLSLGQALFFSLGGYAFGMYLMLHIGEDSVYNTTLPDFMDFLGYKALPPHWVLFESPWFALAAAAIVPGLVALVFGYMLFRSRVKGVYFSIVTQALTYAACLLFFRNDFTFGGNNGFTDFKEILGYDINASGTQRALFILTGLYLSACMFFNWLLLQTKFGKVQQAIRDSENRVRFSGYNTTQYKLFVFVIAGFIGGIAGALFVPQVGIINPEEMRPGKSLEAVVWVAVGGRGTVWGPLIGAVFVNWLKSYCTSSFPDYWLIILGGLFLIVVLFLPDGIAGLPRRISAMIAKHKQKQEAATALPSKEDSLTP